MMLVAQVGSVRCAIPIAYVVETMRPLPVDPLRTRGVPHFVAGLAIVRGQPIPVVDAALLLGVTASNPTRFVIVRTGERRVAIAVDAVLDVRQIDGSTLGGLPPLFASADVAIGALDAELLVVLDSARLVPDATWDALA
jgi:purine-binding chemotaxis protein CheW